jgi:hypothetical protein
LEVLQHTAGGVAAAKLLLAELQPLQQLTHLELMDRLIPEGGMEDLESAEDLPPAAAYSALTASSKLHHLWVEACTVPLGVWEHIFPAGMQLPHLRILDINVEEILHYESYPEDRLQDLPAAAPEGSRLASCCPGLQSLRLALPKEEELPGGAEALLLQLTQLQQLTHLCLIHRRTWELVCKVGAGVHTTCSVTAFCAVDVILAGSLVGLQPCVLQDITGVCVVRW